MKLFSTIRWCSTVALAVIILAIAASGAQAAASASYKGWAYATHPTVPYSSTTPTIGAVTAYKWSTTGWIKTSFELGTSVYAYPYSGVWHWVYRNSTWYALRSNYIAAWSCTASSRTLTDISIHTVRHYNSTTSEIYGYIGQGSSARVLCSNTFQDAAVNPTQIRCMAIGCGPDVFMLVETSPMPRCLWPLPNEPMCMIAMPIGGFPKKIGYVQLTEMELYGINGSSNPWLTS